MYSILISQPVLGGVWGYRRVIMQELAFLTASVAFYSDGNVNMLSSWSDIYINQCADQ